MKESLIGKIYTRLTVVGQEPSKNRQRMWRCRCQCGNIIIVATHQLASGNTRSCGCLQKETAANSGKKTLTTHGLSRIDGKKTRLFRIWSGMKTRCFNHKAKEYPRYGGKGVTICKDWMSYATFHEWAMNNGYNETLSIERVDVNGDYCPQNCRWATPKEQANNRTSTRFVEYENKKYTLAQLAEKLGVSIQAIHQRFKNK